MNYELKKTELTFDEIYNFINNVTDSVFIENEDGTTTYSPILKYTSLQANFFETYTNMEFVEDFNTNYKEYMSMDINYFIEHSYQPFNFTQWNFILKSIDETIDFRKQQLLQQNNSVSNYVTELLQLQIENQKLQKKIMQQTEELNNKFTPEEIKEMSNNIKNLNTNINKSKVQKGLVNVIVDQKKVNTPAEV